MRMNILEEQLMLMFAFRYALGRQSTAPSTVVEIIERNWDIIPKGDEIQMRKEIQAYEKMFGLSDIDKPTWWKIVNKVVRD